MELPSFELNVNTIAGDESAEISEALEARFFRPLKRPRTHKAGVELEYPICNLDAARPVDYAAVRGAADDFMTVFGFQPVATDDDGNVYRATSVEGDEISFECSYNTLEFSFAPTEDLGDVYSRFERYYPAFKDALLRRDHTITGMGVNPRWRVNRAEPIRSSRYRMLLRYLQSYPAYHRPRPFHCYPHFGLFTCASQVQVDIDETNAVQAVNAFTHLEPFKTILLANSPFGNRYSLLCGRDFFWRDSLHGLNPHNCDLYRLPFRQLSDIRSYLTTTSLYNVERDGRYIHFAPITLQEYLQHGQINGEAVTETGFEPVSFMPRADDVRFLRPFKFEDITWRGTLEFRSVCEQPVSDVLSSAAFHVGLMERLDDLTEILDWDDTLYGHGYNVSELRELFNRREWPAFVERKRLSHRLTELIDLAADGCRARGKGEEKYLQPLYGRAETLVSPARVFADAVEAGQSIDDLIERYG